MTSITLHPAKAGYYLVQIDDGGLYEVAADTGACSCNHYVFRLADKPGELCKHGQALAEHLAAERTCPLCRGYGAVALRNRYVGEAPPCVLCEGSGQKSHGLSDGDLRELFR